jgi:hypothetical protein
MVSLGEGKRVVIAWCGLERTDPDLAACRQFAVHNIRNCRTAHPL